MPGITPMRLLLVALAAAAIYAGALRHGFVFDDHQIIEANPMVTGPGRLAEIAMSHYWHPLRPQGYLYRPLTILSFRVDHMIGGGSPVAFHAASILLHAGVSVLVALCVALFLSAPGGGAAGRPHPDAGTVGLVAGLLFATHPVHSEAVAGIAGRADLLAALFAALAWYLHMRATGPGWAWGAGGCFFASLLAKESAVALPAILVLSDRLARTGPVAGDRPGRALRRYGPSLAALAVYLALRAALLEAPMGGDASLIHPLDNPVADAPALVRIATGLKVLALDALLLVFPRRLSADYSYNQVSAASGLLDPSALAGLALAAAGLALAWAFRARRFGPAFPILFFLVAIAPVSNVPVPIGTIMAERILYWPSLGACAGLALLARGIAARLAGARPAGATLAIGLVVSGLFAVRTIVRVPDWTDDRALFAAAARTSPASAKPAYNLGMLLLKGGDPAGAIPWLERAVDNARGLARGRADLMRDLATALEAAGRRDEALSLLERARRSEPGHSGVLINLGNMLAARGDSARAIDAYDEALALEPDHAGGLTNRARMLLRTGRPGDAERAVADLERASSAAPGMSEALYHLGEAYAAAGRRQDAAAAFRRFLDRAGPDQESLARAARRRLDQIEEN